MSNGRDVVVMSENNSVYSAMAQTACRVLAGYGARLPEVAGVDIRSTTQGTHPARFRQAITFQCNSGSSEVTAVARWAAAFDAPVRLLRRDGYVEVSTQRAVDGHPVLVWDHITSDEADTLVAALGERLATVLDINPGPITALTRSQK